jgi:two-component system chemotaxis response regulator CheV
VVSVLESVNQRTNLVGHNRLELLLFRLGGPQLYGINVFKVREVLHCPELHVLPNPHPHVRGVAHLRGAALSIVDMGAAIGLPAIERPRDHLVIITEYNMNIQGFLVNSVDRILNKNWESVLPPPQGIGAGSYLTAVTQSEDQLIEILDVEKIISEISPLSESISDELITRGTANRAGRKCNRILIVDDSAVARKQIERTVNKLGLESVLVNDGRAALNHIHELLDNDVDIHSEYAMIISDVEMPEMDGYTLTTELKADPRTRDLYIMLHTSLSGVFNHSMVQKVGADGFMAKFRAEELAERIVETLAED